MKKIFLALAYILAAAGMSVAQTPQERSDYFPEAAEIGASSRISGQGFESAADLAKIKDGRLVSDVGFIRYDRSDYSGASPQSIEVFKLLDSWAAYSLLTLLRENQIEPGPPGDFFTTGNDGLLFAQGRFFVRILGKDAPKELLEKSAALVSAKIEQSGGEPPGLPGHFPSEGYDASSLRYFPSQASYKTWIEGKAPAYINTDYNMEIATARYYAGSRSGTVSLLKFPTSELAEEYYDEFMVSAPAVPNGLSVYARRAGPLIACLEGNFDPVSADKLLSTVKYGYSLRWDYNPESGARIVWGIPTSILKAVVNSLFFSAIAVLCAILIGSMIGVGRFVLREYNRKHSLEPADEDPGFTRLILNGTSKNSKIKACDRDKSGVY